MMNYMKSEWYRITHTGMFYATMACFVFLCIFYNAVNYFFDTQYATTSFAYSNLVAFPVLFAYSGAIIAAMFYEDNRKNGNLKNTISIGISRSKILVGKCIVSVLAATVIMAVTILLFIISAEILLKNAGPVKMDTLLEEIPVVYLFACSAVVLILVLMELFHNIIAAILVWEGIFIVLPKIILVLGMRYSFVYKIALWIPYNLFSMINGKQVNMRICVTAWDTTEGVVRCIFPSMAGILVFAIIGILVVRKKDLD